MNNTQGAKPTVSCPNLVVPITQRFNTSGTSTSQTGSKWEQALQRLRKEDQEHFNAVNKSTHTPLEVLDGVLAAVSKRKEDCLRKRWNTVVDGRTIYIRDVLEKISAIGDIVIQYDPRHAALPWAAMRLIMQTGINDLEVFGYITVSLENLASIMAQCYIIESVYLNGRESKIPKLSTQLTESVINLYAAILRYLADLVQYFNLSTGKRILKSIGQSQKDFQTKYSPINHALETFGRLAGVAQAAKLGEGLDLIESLQKQLDDIYARDEKESIWLKTTFERLQQPIDRIDTRLQEISDGLGREDRLRILNAISKIPYNTHHKEERNGRVEGSGEWFLKKPEFKEWRRSSSPSVLWLHGIPGSGKTKLTSLVIDELLGHEHVAYFYCTRNPAEAERAQCDKILRSLVRQLASVGPRQPMLGPVAKCYRDAMEGGAGEPEDLALMTDESVKVLLKLFDKYPAVALVLDALDEVNQESRQELLDALSNLIQESTTLVRIFISSRSNYDISLSLAGAPNIYIGANDNAEDISSFILHAIIVKTLNDGAKGMFRWADLQIQSLRPLKVAADVSTRLGVLPTTLEASYRQIYQDIIDSGDNALALATFTFQWLLYAQEPMSLDGFAALASIALATESSTKFTAVEVLDVCANLVVLRESSFEFAHLSVREFFEKLGNRQIDVYSPEEGHAALAQACLRFLNQALDPGQIARKRIKRLMCSEASEFHDKDSGKDTGRVSEEGSSEPEGEVFPASWVMDYGRDILAHLYPPTIIAVIAVISSDIGGGVPSNYVITWMVYHVNAARSLRLRPALRDLLKTFALQPAESISEATSRRSACFYAVAPSFHAWHHLAKLPYTNTRHRLSTMGIKLPSSPIWLACEFRWLELVEYLYQNPYDAIDEASLVYIGKFNPFWYAIATGRIDVANCIASCTGNKKQAFSEKGGFLRLLRDAVTNDDAAVIKRLAKLYPGDHEAATGAFTEAAFFGHHEAMGLIIESSSTSIERAVRAQAGPDCLATACGNGSVEKVKSLIENATTTTTTTVTTGNRFLYLAVSAGHVEVVHLLLEKQIGLGGISTALNIAVSMGNKTTTDLLTQHGGKKDGAVLLKAVALGKQQIALRLITAGYGVNDRWQPPTFSCSRKADWTALHFAVENDDCEVVKALLAHESNADAPDILKQTPLHLAAARGRKDCVDILMKSGADLRAEDYLGRTALQLAQEFNHVTVIDLIERYIQMHSPRESA
ncbi:hypothetical protein FHL15_007756 [Xylaria flabelliformis]|uniref:Uncharacterized protein n=1 Tax=Xylaria flabelliformis TaxID=2512241 RepID=A0A553HTQ5_9PEZI|nr:hypothetical protein FHL15_007756 [Xylaria flabelliformis]